LIEHRLPSLAQPITFVNNMVVDPRIQAVESALTTLRDRITVEEEPEGPDSHVVVRVTGLEEPDCREALGVYLTGLVANVVRIDLQLANVLLGVGADADAELSKDVERLIGASNVVDDTNTPVAGTITSDFRDDFRNSWIAEGIGHALVSLPETTPGPCIPGVLHALTLPHHKSSQQGLDAVAIYDDEDFLALQVVLVSQIEALRSSSQTTRSTFTPSPTVGLKSNVHPS
jgi:hypothetical protein